MINKKKKIIFYILDFIMLMLSYMLCDYITYKLNLIIGIIIGLIFYLLSSIFLYKIFKIEIK